MPLPGGMPMEVLACGDEMVLVRPCVDRGLMTGHFCDGCQAASRCPREQWADGQMTPLCSYCDNARGECHFCSGLSWCVPPPSKQHHSTEATSTEAASADTTSAVVANEK